VDRREHRVDPLADLLPGSTFSLLQVGSNVILQYSAAAVPEIDPSSLGSALALLIGSLGLVEKRRCRFARSTLAA